MTTERPSIIQATHLARVAYVYVRQSTLRQVAQNTESTRRQYALRERAAALGWSDSQIEVIDCDQGLSGTSAADREGFQRLVTEVSMSRAGIVLGLEVSRLARNCADWHRLLEICALTRTLILDEDGLYDPTDFNDRLLLGIKGTMSEAELHLLRARLRGGLLAKARRGELRTRLPVGLVYDEQERVHMHPDAQVRQSIRLLFETFRRTQSACATVKYFTEQSLLFPRPADHGSRSTDVLWRPLTLSTAVRILHNPRYAGAFSFGRRRFERRPDGGGRVVNLPREQWHALVLDVHEGYIDWEEFEQIQQRLKRSALAYGLENRRSAPREGPALLQGLVLCGVCGDGMTVRYHERSGTLVPDYICYAGMQRRQPSCQVIAGASIDCAVGERLVSAMTPMAIELTLAVQAELQARIDEVDRLRQQQVERAKHEAELARRRYIQVDPDNRLVATTLEADWNEKLRALDAAKQEASHQRAADRATFDQTTQERIRALAEDFPTVWNDPATSHRDRKRMAQLLIEDVTLLKADRLHLHIRFKGGATESLELPLPKNAWQKRLTHPDVVARVEQLLQQYDENEAAERLNAEGLRTGAQKPFDATAVCWVRYSYAIKTPEARLREAGKLTAREMAARLGRNQRTVREWAQHGRLRAGQHGRKAVWLFDPIEEQPVAIQELAAKAKDAPIRSHRLPNPTPPKLRARIEELRDDHHDVGVAEQLNTEGWHTNNGSPFNAQTVRRIRRRCGIQSLWTRLRQTGKLTSVDMAVCLGIGLRTVSDWARKGRLRARRCGQGTRARWLFDPIEEQPEDVRQLASARAALGPRRGVVSAEPAGEGAV